MLLRRFLPVLFAIGALALTGCVSAMMKTYEPPPAQIVILHYSPPVSLRALDFGQHVHGWRKVAANAAPAAPNRQVFPDRRDTDTEPKEGYIKRAKMLLYLIRSRHWRSLPYDQTS
ncbi:hypothetical protein [Rhizobium lusitanum]|uniref:Lipoprotein n=1 Tax=Rhizobium lusitanum TaxID=293958 RepID=A0A7X0IPT1_9HYPH|nr:hypothetical protein [Rhizobium lusitanum]MBB6484619.1 hypothetical protein [Rhizobium lusitanum]